MQQQTLDMSKDADLDAKQLRVRLNATQRVNKLQEQEIRRLLMRLEALLCENAQLKGKAAGPQLELEIARLQRELAAAQRQHGEKNRSEKRSRADEADQDGNTTKPHGHGPTPQPALPIVTAPVCELDEPDRVCPECGDRLQPMPGQHETSEQIHYIPAQIVLLQVDRQKYRCENCTCGHMETALGPTPLVKGGRYTPEFGAQVALDKYLDHLPLERQVRRFSRLGLTVTSQTLWDQLQAMARLGEPTYRTLPSLILREPVIGMDQTGWPCLDGDKVGRKAWQMWCLCSHDAVFYAIEDHKDTATGLRLLGNYAGIVVCDDFSTHTAMAHASSASLACCWAHMRRRFVDAERDFPEAAAILDMIGELYQIESRAGPQADRTRDTERARLRDTESRSIAKAIHARLTTLGTTTARDVSLGSAIHYALSNWKRLLRFLDDPTIWIDNNLSERCLRGPVIGRRNHFGSKSARGTQVAATLYSLIETAKLSHVDPAAYLATMARRALENPGTITLPADVR